jgi:glycosyltransferase involved in cell wall biosynthesis
MRLSLVLPAFNEAAIAAESVNAVDEVLAGLDIEYEIIVADDGSEDGTTEVVEAIGLPSVRVVRRSHQGKGAALSTGLSEASGTYVGFLDIDLEISADYVPEFVAALNDGYDVAIASKVLDPAESRQRPLKKRLATAGYNWLARRLFKTSFGDHQAGLKLFRREALSPVIDLVESTGWLWDTEVLTRCVGNNCRVKEIGVVTRPVRAGHVSVVYSSMEVLRQLVALRKSLNSISLSPDRQ